MNQDELLTSKRAEGDKGEYPAALKVQTMLGGGGCVTFRSQLPFVHYWLNKQPWGKGVEGRALLHAQGQVDTSGCLGKLSPAPRGPATSPCPTPGMPRDKALGRAGITVPRLPHTREVM